MKVIGFEEHYKLPAISDVHDETTASSSPRTIPTAT